ncbi:hypothetical protein ACIF8T_31840 [Streptomyces sp. NPDC085946]|uniref:hypothetical protein n=1 Tax=Streptomyces sp. NPDC085946 TaxID=3365744 RepID=UPI0037CF20B3
MRAVGGRRAGEAPSGEVRAAALSLLGPEDGDTRTAREDVRRPVQGLDDPHEPVRHHAAAGLLRWAEAAGALPPDGGRARARLALLASGDGSVRVRGAAVDVLEAPAAHGPGA